MGFRAGDIDGQVRSLVLLLLLTVIKAPLGHVLAGHSLLPESCVPAAPHLCADVRPLRNNQPVLDACQTDFLRKGPNGDPVGKTFDAPTHGRGPGRGGRVQVATTGPLTHQREVAVDIPCQCR